MCYDAPKPPDPVKTGAAQTATNIGTAVAGSFLNNVDQFTPQGSLTYGQTGTYEFTDPVSGESYDIPTFSATQAYSPDQQALYDQSNQTRLGLSQLAGDQTERIQGIMSEPWNPDTSQIEGRLFDMGQQLMDPVWQERNAQLEQKLANQGIQQGSAAWDSEMRAVNDARSREDLNLMFGGRGQALAELQAIRNQPINEISALMSGSQVSQPNWISPSQTSLPATDYAGLMNNNYNQQLAGYNAEQAATGNLLGGLFKLGGSFLAPVR